MIIEFRMRMIWFQVDVSSLFESRLAFNDDSALIPFFFTIHRSNLGLSRVRIGIGKRTTRFEPRFYFHYQLNSIIQHPTLSLSLVILASLTSLALSLFNLSQRSPSNPLISTNSISNHPRSRVEGRYASRIPLFLSFSGGEEEGRGNTREKGQRCDNENVPSDFHTSNGRKKKRRSILSGR